METERRCLIRLGKRRAACGDEKVPREDASEVLASVQRVCTFNLALYIYLT